MEVLDELMDKWEDKSGDGCFKDEMLADQDATKVDQLEEWDSDEDMEDIEFDCLDSLEDMDNPEADIVMKKEDVPMEGDDCWDRIKEILSEALQEPDDDDEVKIDKLRHQLDRDVEGRGYKRFVKSSEDWMELNSDWMDEQPARRRKFARQITKDFYKLIRKSDEANKLKGVRGIWEMACRPENHTNIDDDCLTQLVRELRSDNPEILMCASGSIWCLWESFLEKQSELRKRIDWVIEELLDCIIRVSLPQTELDRESKLKAEAEAAANPPITPSATSPKAEIAVAATEPEPEAAEAEDGAESAASDASPAESGKDTDATEREKFELPEETASLSPHEQLKVDGFKRRASEHLAGALVAFAAVEYSCGFIQHTPNVVKLVRVIEYNSHAVAALCYCLLPSDKDQFNDVQKNDDLSAKDKLKAAQKAVKSMARLGMLMSKGNQILETEAEPEKKKGKTVKKPKANKIVRAVTQAVPDMALKASRLLLNEDVEVRLCAAAVIALIVRDNATVLLMNSRTCFRNMITTLRECVTEYKRQLEASKKHSRENGAPGSMVKHHHHVSHAARHAHSDALRKVPVRTKSRTLDDSAVLMTILRFLANILHGCCFAMMMGQEDRPDVQEEVTTEDLHLLNEICRGGVRDKLVAGGCLRALTCLAHTEKVSGMMTDDKVLVDSLVILCSSKVPRVRANAVSAIVGLAKFASGKTALMQARLFTNVLRSFDMTGRELHEHSSAALMCMTHRTTMVMLANISVENILRTVAPFKLCNVKLLEHTAVSLFQFSRSLSKRREVNSHGAIDLLVGWIALLLQAASGKVEEAPEFVRWQLRSLIRSQEKEEAQQAEREADIADGYPDRHARAHAKGIGVADPSRHPTLVGVLEYQMGTLWQLAYDHTGAQKLGEGNGLGVLMDVLATCRDRRYDRVRLWAVATIYAACEKHPPNRITAVNMGNGLLELLLRVSLEGDPAALAARDAAETWTSLDQTHKSPHREVQNISVRFLALQLLHWLVKDDYLKRTDKETAERVKKLASRRGVYSLECASLLMLQSDHLPAAQEYAATTLARLSVDFNCKRSVAKLGGLEVLMGVVRRYWDKMRVKVAEFEEYVTAKKEAAELDAQVKASHGKKGKKASPAKAARRDGAGAEAAQLSLEEHHQAACAKLAGLKVVEEPEVRLHRGVCTRALHCLLNLSTFHDNQLAITRLGMKLLLEIARSGKQQQQQEQVANSLGMTLSTVDLETTAAPVALKPSTPNNTLIGISDSSITADVSTAAGFAQTLSLGDKSGSGNLFLKNTAVKASGKWNKIKKEVAEADRVGESFEDLAVKVRYLRDVQEPAQEYVLIAQELLSNLMRHRDTATYFYKMELKLKTDDAWRQLLQERILSQGLKRNMSIEEALAVSLSASDAIGLDGAARPPPAQRSSGKATGPEASGSGNSAEDNDSSQRKKGRNAEPLQKFEKLFEDVRKETHLPRYARPKASDGMRREPPRRDIVGGGDARLQQESLIWENDSARPATCNSLPLHPSASAPALLIAVAGDSAAAQRGTSAAASANLTAAAHARAHAHAHAQGTEVVLPDLRSPMRSHLATTWKNNQRKGGGGIGSKQEDWGSNSNGLQWTGGSLLNGDSILDSGASFRGTKSSALGGLNASASVSSSGGDPWKPHMQKLLLAQYHDANDACDRTKDEYFNPVRLYHWRDAHYDLWGGSTAGGTIARGASTATTVKFATTLGDSVATTTANSGATYRGFSTVEGREFGGAAASLGQPTGNSLDVPLASAFPPFKIYKKKKTPEKLIGSDKSKEEDKEPGKKEASSSSSNNSRRKSSSKRQGSRGNNSIAKGSKQDNNSSKENPKGAKNAKNMGGVKGAKGGDGQSNGGKGDEDAVASEKAQAEEQEEEELVDPVDSLLAEGSKLGELSLYFKEGDANLPTFNTRKTGGGNFSACHIYCTNRLNERIEDLALERCPMEPWHPPTLTAPWGGLFEVMPSVPRPSPPKDADPPEPHLPDRPSADLPDKKTVPGPTWGILPDQNMYFIVITLGSVMPPTMSPDSGDVQVETIVKMTCDTDEAVILFTANGGDPELNPDSAVQVDMGDDEFNPFKQPEKTFFYDAATGLELAEIGEITIRAVGTRFDMKPSVVVSEDYNVKPKDQVKKLWVLPDSIWVPRTKESEAKDFFDSAKVHKRTFELDWKRCVQKKTFQSFLKKYVGEGPEADKEISEIKKEVWEDYDVITHAFDFYAACSRGSGFSVKLNAYSDFLDDCFIPEEGSAHCNRQVMDTIFVVTNAEDENVDSKENKANADRELMRFEWVEMLVRVAFAKYVDSGKIDDPSEAIDEMCDKNILAHLEPAAAQHRNDFRSDRLYNEEVDDILRPKLPLLRKIFDTITKDKPGSAQKMISLDEWTKFFEQVEILNDDFTKRECQLCFVWSKMRVIDELKNRHKWTHATFMDFLEALARSCEMMTLPDDSDIAELGVDNVVEWFWKAEKMDLGEQMKKAGTRYAEMHDGDVRPLSDRLDKFLQLLWSKYDPDGDGTIVTADIVRYHAEGKRFKQPYEKFMLELKKGSR